MKQIVFAVALLGAMFMSQVAEARSGHYKRSSQRDRIHQGIKSGNITHREAMQLRMQQAKIRNFKAMAMADGRVTHSERALIRNEQRHANHNIYHQKHDKQRRHFRK